MILLKQAKRNPYLFFKEYNWKEIALRYHPDRYGDDKLFREFKLLYEQSQKEPICVADYILVQHISRGDLCDIYRAETGEIVKIPFVISKAANNLLAKENEVLHVLNEESKNTKYKDYFPFMKKTFLFEGKRINVFETPDIVSLVEIKEKYKDGLDGRHIAWMFKRLLVALGYLHNLNWCHNAITPEHSLFQVSNHGLCLIDWIHAEQIGKPIKIVPKSKKEWYKVKQSSITLDIHLATQSMLYIANKSLNRRIENFLYGCFGIEDAWQLHDEFSELLEELYGPPKFVPLDME